MNEVAMDCWQIVIGLLPLLPVLAPLAAALGIAAGMLLARDAGGEAPVFSTPPFAGAPFAGAPFAGASFAASDAAERPAVRLALGAALLALAALAALDAAAIAGRLPPRLALGAWFAAEGFAIPLEFSLDTLSLGLATLIAVIAAATLRFSVHYLHREAGFQRFFLGMSLFLAGMMLIVLAGNAALAFVGWELAGLSSFLLIGYAYERETASGNALAAFATNRIGDAGFLLALALAFLWFGGSDWQVFDPHAGAAGGDLLAARVVALGFVLAALVKSAQLPFSAWIARALEGPTPSSAIFYGAVMVHAGVYLLVRLEPLLVQLPDVMAGIAILGAATAIYAGLAGRVQSDVKSALIFATQAQVGLMFLACGLGYFTLAAWHLALHAAWRAYQFLLAPSWLHLPQQPPRRQPRPAPALYAAALSRLWLEPLQNALLLRPLRALGEDVRRLDDEVLHPLSGAPAIDSEDDAHAPAARGAGGALLQWLAGHARRVEAHMLLQAGQGLASRALRQIGRHLLNVEALLERPRYLALLVLLTFAVIL